MNVLDLIEELKKYLPENRDVRYLVAHGSCYEHIEEVVKLYDSISCEYVLVLKEKNYTKKDMIRHYNDEIEELHGKIKELERVHES